MSKGGCTATGINTGAPNLVIYSSDLFPFPVSISVCWSSSVHCHVDTFNYVIKFVFFLFNSFFKRHLQFVPTNKQIIGKSLWEIKPLEISKFIKKGGKKV